MAKSIRSKWKRKMRAVKRERYAKKELVRLKKTLGIDETHPSTTDENMQDLSEIVTVVSVEDVKNKKTTQEEDVDIIHMSEMNDIKKFNPKTLRNENGAYPVWVHPRKIKKAKKKLKNKGRVTKSSKKGKGKTTVK